MKTNIVVLGIDDSPHSKEDLSKARSKDHPPKIVQLISVSCKGSQLLYVGHHPIEVDGIDATSAVIALFEDSPFKHEIKLILINSPTVGGFNIINPRQIFDRTKVPIVFLSENRPTSNISEVYTKVFPDRLEQISTLQNLTILEELTVPIITNPKITGKVYYYIYGATNQEIKPVLLALGMHSALPEPLRLAHIIAATFSNEV
jgi:endonuclease V-like protein UPF0215 family